MGTHYAAKTKIIEIETWLEGTLEELNKTNKSLKYLELLLMKVH